MKHFKSFAALLLVLAFVLVPCAGAFAEETPAEQWDQLPLGTTGYAVKAPAGYSDLGITEEEDLLGVVANYYNPETELEIEVSRYAVAAEGFEAFAKAQAELFNGTGLEMTELCGLPAARYSAEWDFDGETYKNVTALFDAGSGYIAVDFNYFGKEADKTEEINAILATFGTVETENIRLGSSPYFVTLSKGYYKGEVTPEENAAGLVAYYLNDNLLFDFDVYENAAEGTLEEVAQQLCTADKGSELTLQDLNGVPAYTFTGHDVYDGVEYDTLTCVLDSTNGTFIAVVCWIDNEPMRESALQMLASLKTEDELIPDEPMTLRISDSSVCITLPSTFLSGGVSEEEFSEEGYVAYYYSPYTLFDFGVFQYKVEDELPTLTEFTEEDAADFNGTEIALDEEINGVHYTSYHSDEEYDGINYHCATYSFEEKGNYYQICFFWTDEDAEADVEAVMETLAPVEMTTLALCSDLSVTMPAGFETTPIEYEEYEGLTATKYEKAPLTFIVYDLPDLEGIQQYTLDEFAALECEQYNGTDLNFTEINGIPVAYYYYTDTDELCNSYAILTYCIRYGESGYLDIDFYIDDYVAMYQAQAVINSLTK